MTKNATNDVVVGIDLGTTNSEIAAFHRGRVRVLGPGERKILPSCVGVTPSGQLLVGDAARNQQLVHPERTIRSVKRKMGSSERITLGESTYTPAEVSSFILRELVRWAELELGSPVKRAVITVPAYFSDAQRNATREAGALAGLEVLRILNEPTAASLAYGATGEARRVMVYDLGGGTFDVSVVLTEADITEVLATHGNNRLGGDDFDDLLAGLLAERFREAHGIALPADARVARSRLWWAAEDAKRRLSAEPAVRVREDALLVVDGKPLHLDVEVTRDEYETLIRPLVESTLDSAWRALQDAKIGPAELAGILLVGGATRTPLVTEVLQKAFGIEPRSEVHPDLCVALGAGVLASRLAGRDVERVLVDVSPFSFGPSYLGVRDGIPYPHCYRPVIRRNTALPVRRSEDYMTATPFQQVVELLIYQGEDEDALKNTLIGAFTIEGLSSTEEPNTVACTMVLDVDGILHVTATEKSTGMSKQVAIANALQTRTPAEVAALRRRLEETYAQRVGDDAFVEADDGDEFDDEGVDEASAGVPAALVADARSCLARSAAAQGGMADDDREDALGLQERIEAALATGDAPSLRKALDELRDLLFFVEGRR